MDELTGKEATPEEASTEVAAPEEVPVANALPCLEELVWATLQEVHKMRESAERGKHFEYRIWEELHKLVTLKGREVSLVQGSIAPAGVMQRKSQVQEKGKRKAREPEKEDETFV